MKHYLQSLTKAFQRLPLEAAMLFFVAMLLMPQKAWAYEWEDYDANYPFWDGLYYSYNNGNPYIEWKTILFDANGDDEGFYRDKNHDYGLAVYIAIGNDQERFIGYIACHDEGYYRGLYRDGKSEPDDIENPSYGYGGTWHFGYGEGKLNDHKTTWIVPRWYIPFEYRNSNIRIHLRGTWWKWTRKHGSHNVDVSKTVATPYTYTVQNVEWNGTYTVSEDGVVTIPYALSGSGNTSGRTHMCTRINGYYNGTIGYKNVTGSYTFKLGDIGMDFNTSFTICPYHEYTHYRDKDANNGTRYYATLASPKMFEALPVPVITDYSYIMKESKVRLTWRINSYSRNGQFVVYRDGVKIATVPSEPGKTNYSFEETNTRTQINFPYDTDVLYTVYYVENGWNENTKKDMLSASCTVSTERYLPIKQFSVTSLDDRVVFTWESDGYPQDWGNHFAIYVDKETEPICNILPRDMQTKFQWEHRTTDKHTSRVTNDAGLLYYTEEPLNGAVPHDYRVVAMIDETSSETAVARHRGINQASRIYELDASKGVYSDKVKLSWRVDQMGSTKLKTYVITRHVAEQNNSDTVTVGTFDSTNDHLSFTDDNPSPGVFYTYTVYVQEKNDTVLFESHMADIGFAQTTGTISGRVTFGSSGMAVEGVNVEARKMEDEHIAAQHHSIRFSETNGELVSQYPSPKYANSVFSDKDFAIQMWINPEQLVKQDFIGLTRGGAYEVYPTEKYINPREVETKSINSIKKTRYYIGKDSECATHNHDATFRFLSVIEMNCIIDETAYNRMNYFYRSAYEFYGTFYDTTWVDCYVTLYDTVPIWKVREISSSWRLGMDDKQQLVLYGGSIDSINGEVPTLDVEYESEPTIVGINQVLTFEGLTLKAGDYNHVTLSRHGDSISCYVIHYDGDTRIVESVTLPFLTSIQIKTAQSMVLGGFVGNIDDFRLWKKALSMDDILDNFDHQLIGTEKDLETYWTFDEGLSSQFFDISRTGTTYHNHHGVVGVNAASSKNVPEHLALKAKTDKDGNYIIHGVPFSGQGTTYAVMPTYGVHSFNPTQQIRFVSNNSLVHNGINFDDISSFSVKGTIYYDGTDYPVEGCNLYVDGVLCTRNGDPITTGIDGTYTISVPIGQHVIQVKKDGHVFANNGRYDNHGDGVEFTSDVSGLDFKDITLVNFTGRVVGGNIEGDKPVGFRLSENNIGKALITMVPQSDKYRLNVKEEVNGTVLKIEANEETTPVSSASPDTIRSTSWRGAGEQCNTIFIRTDEFTGEFSAMVPPIPYIISDITVEWSGSKILDSEMAMDLSYANVVHQDSMVDKNGAMYYYAYHTMLRHTYHPEDASFVVKQNGRKDGSFGIKKYVIQDALGALVVDDIYRIKADTVEYTYGYPLFRTYDPYIFDIEGYEEFVNNDNGDSVVSKVPMANMMVTIDNALALDQSVYAVGNPEGKDPGSVVALQSNQLKLDSLGKAIYSWQAGFPLIVEPYTRTINIYYGSTRKEWSGNPLTGIVLGNMPLGNNFVTRGVDEVDMVLRDPPGSQSFATWEKGTVSLTKKYTAVTIVHDTIREEHVEVGPKCDIGYSNDFSITGELAGQWKDDWGYDHRWEWISSNTISTSISVSESVSTSSRPEYDGADGDVFVGTSTNVIYGDVRKLALYRNPEDSTKAVIDLKDSYSLGMTFPTAFVYTQRHIINTLLPGFVALRNSFLQTVQDINAVKNEGTEPIYVTNYSPTDPDFGTDGTYKAIAPKGKTCTDTVNYYNRQIQQWKKILANNEDEKLRAFHSLPTSDPNRQNRSFDAGSTFSYSYTVDNDTVSDNTTYSNLITTIWDDNDNHGGFTLPIVSYEYTLTRDTGEITTTTTGEEKDEYATFSYTLQDNDADDAISVDIYTNQGKYKSPIFRTRGGQTSNPYEGEVLACYHEPDLHHVIMESTMQVDRPKIDAEPRTRSSVPSGSAATFELKLQNLSEVGAERSYKLMMAENTNPYGAQLFIDGTPLTDGRIIRVPGGQQLSKLLQLKQSDLGILNYERVGVVLASVGQSDPMSGMKIIADTVFVSAYFVPSSSPVSMELDKTTMNTSTGTDLVVTMSGFDRNFYNLKAFRLQYKSQGSNWTTFHEYVLNESDLSGTNFELLPTDRAQIQYTLAMAGEDDGNYDFRIVSVSTHDNKEIYVYSNQLTLIKDTNRPRPLGSPEPTDGILNFDDDVSITFNEPILKGELTNAKNFLVTGVLNGAKIDHDVALHANADIAIAAAQTEAFLNLDNRDFSIEAWINVQSAGTILRHGIGSHTMRVSTDESGMMVVNMEGYTLVSQTPVIRDKWLFFSFSYQNATKGGILNVAVVEDEKTYQLMEDEIMPLYHGNGPLCIGGGAEVAVHELLLWDKARDLTTALTERSVTKNPATRHLAGYWKMDEGEGTVIRDYARNRHMIMPSETWYLNNVNKALVLDGTQTLVADVSSDPSLPGDDFAAEFWMRCGQQTDTATLFRLGQVSMYLDKNGQLHLLSNEKELSTINYQLSTNTWHHIALNVLRLGTAAVYIDGERALTLPASDIGSFEAAYLTMGEGFQGEIDEIRIWHATMSAEQLAANRKLRLNGNEPGLSRYFPFEKKELDEYHQVVTVETLEEMSVDENGNPRGTPATINDQMVNGQMVNYSNEAPALREKRTETNIPFSFTASDTKIVIELTARTERIEGCTIHFTVDNVRDVNGNYSVPATWSAFVHRRALVWGDEELNVTQPVKSSTTFSTTISNRTGAAQMWEITNIPSWLSVTPSGGTLNPLEQVRLTFTTDAATAIGHYEQTLYLTTTDSIELPLPVRLKVTGDVPEWNVNPNGYDMSMNIIGQLDIFGTIAEDEEDFVAAFIGEECRGVAHPAYKARYDGYYITMDIYGSSSDSGEELTFRAYDASTGVLYPLVEPDRTMTFQAPSLVGNYTSPVQLSVSDKIEQSTSLKRGWNWLSLYVQTDKMHPSDLLQSIAEDVIQIKGQSNDEGVLIRNNDKWSGAMDSLRNNKMYLIQMANERILRLVGSRVNPQTCLVDAAHGWNWAGYYGRQISSVSDALAGMDPQDGDIVKGQRGVAYYDDYEWAGSLTFMEPGLGYMIYNTDEPKSFAYPSATVAMAPRKDNAQRVDDQMVNTFTPVDYHQFDGNMTLIAQLFKDGQPLPNTELGIFADEECRAAAVSDENGLVITLVPGNDEMTILSFQLAVDDQIVEANETADYVTNATVGSPEMPFLITIGETFTGTADVSNDQLPVKVIKDNHLYILRNGYIYDATGKKLTR